ncbi:cation-transporting P-type ATPase [Microtetraspora glauca]|uniref:Cation-transporting P-type ATPase n=1 Tax=Microtetraspora glauca TaxID=1996 RepID=A0ABV3GM20_MICGL
MRSSVSRTPPPPSRAASPSSAAAPHGLAAHEVVLMMDTDPVHGLDDDEARRRLARFGPNVLPASARDNTLMRMLRQFHHPLIYILLASGVITAVLGEFVDSAVIFGVVLINAVVGFVQESRAEAALDALRSMVRTEARAVRGGHVRPLPSEELVPGDLVLVEAGDKAPADLRLVRSSELRVDESALTGESAPVAKDEVVLSAATPVADRRNMVYSGTLVTAGTGAGVAVATGARTELGEIHRLVGSAELLATPLTEKLARFSKVLTVAILALAAVTFVIGLIRGEGVVPMFTAAVALAVGAIPEGLPAAVTITLAIGVARMARRRAVIRRLPAVETLGGTTVICSDKTGTLTENQMTVRTLWTPEGDRYDVSGSGYAPEGEIREPGGAVVTSPTSGALRWCLLAGAACNDATLARQDGRWTLTGDPTEGAMLVAAAKAGLDRDALTDAYPRVAAIPFSSERQYMATLHRARGGDHVVLLKGAVERALDLCDTWMDADGGVRPLDGDAVLRAADELAAGGLRVLATAVRFDAEPARRGEPEELDERGLRGTMVLTGLQAMLDPPRAAAARAVRACHAAGIEVKMITGDHAATATAVARGIGLLGDHSDHEVLTGAQLAGLPEEEYPGAVERARVFARVSPEQKLRLVDALQSRGQVVAMTGDGVNDAPALRQANIGVAMGRNGTEVAKEAADMVLTDDDFATIEAAVEEGRGVFDNLTKFIVWTLPTNMAEGLVILVAILFGAALPILPTQILWINMTTAVALGLMLAFEPKEEGIMGRPPRDPARPLLTGSLVARVLLVSTLLVGGSWWLFQWELANGADEAVARTAAVNLFVMVELFYLFSCRSLTRSMWHVGLFSNHWIIGGVTVQMAGQLALTYLPVMNRLFHTAPIGLPVWSRIIGISALASLVVAVDKRVRRRLM